MDILLNETDLLFPANVALIREARRLDVSVNEGRRIEGLLEDREGVCLYVLARRAASLGNVVEIGSWKGRSTWYLARAMEDAGSEHRVVAIDPHLEGTRDAFRANVDGSGLGHRIDVREAYAQDVVGQFDEPIGLLWIDGDHSYSGVKQDFDLWYPRLAPGGWVAFHDTVGHWYGPTRLVRELFTTAGWDRIGVVGMVTYARKGRPTARNRLRGLAARIAFEAVTALRSARMGRSPRNAAPGEA